MALELYPSERWLAVTRIFRTFCVVGTRVDASAASRAYCFRHVGSLNICVGQQADGNINGTLRRSVCL